MPTMLLEILIDDCRIECAEFELCEGAAAKKWIDDKKSFYSPVVIDMLVTIVPHDECVAFMPELDSVLSVN